MRLRYSYEAASCIILDRIFIFYIIRMLLCVVALQQCNQPADSGPCFAYFQKWFYNPSTMKCQTFVYGGCAGNDNRYGVLILLNKHFL